ncbi:MAG: hypothetical protein ACK4K8_19330 [Pannonibacter sp.]
MDPLFQTQLLYLFCSPLPSPFTQLIFHLKDQFVPCMFALEGQKIPLRNFAACKARFAITRESAVLPAQAGPDTPPACPFGFSVKASGTA